VLSNLTYITAICDTVEITGTLICFGPFQI